METLELQESISIEELFEEFVMFLRMRDCSEFTVSAYRANFKIYLEYLDKMKTFILVRLAKPALFYQMEVVFSTHS